MSEPTVELVLSNKKDHAKPKSCYGVVFVGGRAVVPDTKDSVTLLKMLRDDYAAIPVAEAIAKGIVPDPVAEEAKRQAEAKAAQRKAKETEDEEDNDEEESETSEDEMLGEDEDGNEKPPEDKPSEEKPKRKRKRS